MAPTLADIRMAAERIRPYAHRTPVWTCASLDREVGAQVFLKCENLQRVGAFKFRGACNAVFSLSEQEAGRGGRNLPKEELRPHLAAVGQGKTQHGMPGASGFFHSFRTPGLPVDAVIGNWRSRTPMKLPFQDITVTKTQHQDDQDHFDKPCSRALSQPPKPGCKGH